MATISITQRFTQMMAEGFLAEVQGLRMRGDLHVELPSIRAVGYRQLWAHCAGELTLEEAIEQGIIATRQLAKRQMTWMRRMGADITWHCEALPAMDEMVASIKRTISA